MEEQHKKQDVSTTRRRHPRPHQHQHQPPQVPHMEPVTHGAYGGGMYGTEEGDRVLDAADDHANKKTGKPPASETQSADGPDAAKATVCRHKPPPSSGARDVDITGQSYIQ